ncbi:MAG: 3'-5' exoribonuclease YhaM family protein [Phycisphaerae bacterium]
MDAKRQFITQLMPGQTLDQVFLVRDKDLRTTKSGGLYLTCTLADKTGTIPARMWQVSESIYNAIAVDGFLHVKGRVEDYKGTLQFIIDSCRPFAAEKVDLADFLAVTKFDIEQMWAELVEILRDVKDPKLRLLMKKFVEDRDLVASFKRAPAAMSLHHPFIGGLLEHTLSVLRAARAVLPLYPSVNADLVLMGVFLHDIGKAAELTAGTSMTYTDRGQLVGHIVIAAIWVAEKASQVAAETGEPFPQRLLDLIQHIILSHHGSTEFGSPKLPMVPEAFVVHHLDNLDAKVWMTTHAIESDPDAAASFTSFHKSLETRVYKHSNPRPARTAKAPKDDKAPRLLMDE